MYEWMPLTISFVALIAAILKIHGFALFRWSVIIFALGAGQIYFAVIALVLFLVVESKWRLSLHGHNKTAIAIAISFLAILIVTTQSTFTLRTYSELAQLCIYIFIFLLVISVVEGGEQISLILKASVLGSCYVSIAGYFTIYVGWQSLPDLFVGRGSNEGAVFLSLLGVAPAAAMFVRSRNLLYLGAAGVFCLIQLLATSRGSVAVSGMCILAAFYFVYPSRFLRLLFIVAGAYIAFANVDLITSLYEGQLNFSARERLILSEYGWALFQERFWTGWGWGSTFELASAAPTIGTDYPHFHNAYVQFVAELGILGLLLIFGFFYFFITGVISTNSKFVTPAAPALVAIFGIAIAIASISTATLFGADRAVQVCILMALATRTIALAKQPDMASQKFPVPSLRPPAGLARS